MMRKRILSVTACILTGFALLSPMCHSTNKMKESVGFPTGWGGTTCMEGHYSSPKTINITQITDNDVGDLYPLISDNGHIAYTAEINGTIEVFLWNGIENQRLTYNDYNDDFYFSQNPNQINNKGQFVWQGEPSGTKEIFFWNGADVLQLTNNTNHDSEPVINDNGWITWSAKFFNGSADSEIVLWDGKDTIQISHKDYSDWWPSINNKGQIAWLGATGPSPYDHEIFFWDGNQTIQLTDDLAYDHPPRINDLGHVVWYGNLINDDPEVYFWNGTEIKQITDNAHWDSSVEINNIDEIVWMDSFYDAGNNTEYRRIMYYDGFDTSIISSHIDNNQPEINDNGQVVWYRREIDNATFQSCEVYYWDGGEPIRLTNNSYYDINPQINNLGQVVWSGFDGYDEEIFTTTIEPKIKHTENLEEGWNLISLPVVQSNESIDNVLNSIAGKWDCIRTYDSVTETWVTSIIGRPDQLNNFDTLNHKVGFWINITEPGGTIMTVSGFKSPSTSIPLYAGWNLVGYPSLVNETVANALWGTGADQVMVCDTSEPYHIKEVGPTYVMKPGEGYWVHVPADSTWIVNW